LQQGQTCSLDGTTPDLRCDVDLFCIATTENSRTGVCRPLCDMWQPNQACPAGSACGLLTLETGVCDNTTATGRRPFDNCTPTLDWCSQGVRCFETGTPPATENFCLSYCRPNGSDCNGVSFQGLPTLCETVFVDANMETVDNVGLCFPPQ
jgi:hypothetical protein